MGEQLMEKDREENRDSGGSNSSESTTVREDRCVCLWVTGIRL